MSPTGTAITLSVLLLLALLLLLLRLLLLPPLLLLILIPFLLLLCSGILLAYAGWGFQDVAIETEGLAIDALIPNVFPVAFLGSVEDRRRSRLTRELLRIVALQNLASACNSRVDIIVATSATISTFCQARRRQGADCAPL